MLKVTTPSADCFYRFLPEPRLKQIKALKKTSRKQEAAELVKSTKLVLHKYADSRLGKEQELDELRWYGCLKGTASGAPGFGLR